MNITAGARAIAQNNLESIAAACHQANRMWCDAHGDVVLPVWSSLPEPIQKSTVRGVLFALVPGTTPESQHQAWMADRLAEGWTLGPVKDVVLKTSPNLVPYDQLPAEQRAKDVLFRGVVNAFMMAYSVE